MIVSRSNFMHLMRWLAALMVLISHLRQVLFEDFVSLKTASSAPIKLFYLLTSLGHEAVIVFFVLSGYLIGQSVINQTKDGKFNFVMYMINRVSRLYSVLMVALILTVIFDYSGMSFDDIGLYNNKISIATLNFSVIERLSINHFLASLFMLQNVVLPPLGSNSPLWSLNYEFWYYLLFPAIVVPLYAIANKKPIKTKIIYIVLSLALFILLPWPIIQYFSLWLLGLVPIYLKLSSKYFKYLFGALFIGVLVVSEAHLIPFSEFQEDLLLSVIFTAWLSSFAGGKNEERFYNLNEKLASFSYTLYLVHLPFLVCLLSFWHKFSGNGIKMLPSLSAFTIFFILLIIVYVFSYAVASITEFKTKNVKDFLAKILIRQNRVIEI